MSTAIVDREKSVIIKACQFLRLDAGGGRAQMGATKDQLDNNREVEDGLGDFRARRHLA